MMECRPETPSECVSGRRGSRPETGNFTGNLKIITREALASIE